MSGKTTEEPKFTLPVGHPQAAYLSPDLSKETGSHSATSSEEEAWAKARDEARDAEAEAAAEHEDKVAHEEIEAAAKARDGESKDKDAPRQTSKVGSS